LEFPAQPPSNLCVSESAHPNVHPSGNSIVDQPKSGDSTNELELIDLTNNTNDIQDLCIPNSDPNGLSP
jgi:ubiquitin-protein ligase